ncbi:MAG: hypothetical protein SYC29_18065 [Planctomycetota bacterium]|nr:hypothetical protein [Planctomycetota bacterium]
MLDFAIFMVVCVAVSVLCHWRIRHYVGATAVATAAGVAINLADETIRPALLNPGTSGFGMDDLIFWGPILVVLSAVPALLIALIVGIPFAAGRFSSRRRHLLQERGLCPSCGYDLRGDFAAGCPECGWNRPPDGESAGGIDAA